MMAARFQMQAEGPRQPVLSFVTCAIAVTSLAILGGCRVSRPDADHAKSQILYTAVASDPRTFNPILITD